MSRHHQALCALLPAVFVFSAATVRADTPVDTAYQSWGVAPRIEFELGPQFAMGLGHACREEPVADGEEPTQSCNSGFFMMGLQGIALVRPFAHWALGVLYAYDAVLGAHEVTVDPAVPAKASTTDPMEGSTTDPMAGDATKAIPAKKSAYVRNAKRLGVEVRWYSRSVATSGLYVGVHAGALWWKDKVKPITDPDASQLAPEVGIELGGVFAPYRGFGTTLGVQSWVAYLRNSPQRSTADHGSTYGYGPFVFVGLVARVELGISM